MPTLAPAPPILGKSVGPTEKFIFHVQIPVCFHHFPGLLMHNSVSYLKRNLKSRSRLLKFLSPCDPGEQAHKTQLVGQLLRGLAFSGAGFGRNGQRLPPSAPGLIPEELGKQTGTQLCGSEAKDFKRWVSTCCLFLCWVQRKETMSKTVAYVPGGLPAAPDGRWQEQSTFIKHAGSMRG